MDAFFGLSPPLPSPPLPSPPLPSPPLPSPPLPSPPLPSPPLPSPPLPSPHLTSPHLPSPHLPSPPLTSPHLTSPHFTSLSYHRYDARSAVFLDSAALCEILAKVSEAYIQVVGPNCRRAPAVVARMSEASPCNTRLFQMVNGLRGPALAQSLQNLTALHLEFQRPQTLQTFMEQDLQYLDALTTLSLVCNGLHLQNVPLSPEGVLALHIPPWLRPPHRHRRMSVPRGFRIPKRCHLVAQHLDRRRGGCGAGVETGPP